MVFGAVIALIIGVGAVAVVAVSALVSGDARTGAPSAVEQPEQQEPIADDPVGNEPLEDNTAGNGAVEDGVAEDEAVEDGAAGGGIVDDAGEQETATIRVIGDGIEFRGAIRGAGVTRYVGGVAPARYRVPVTPETRAIRASFQKQGEPGVLTVQIVSGGEVVAEDEIQPSLGRASVAWTPDDE